MSETTLNIVSTGYLQYMEADVTILIEKLRRGRRGRRKRRGRKRRRMKKRKEKRRKRMRRRKEKDRGRRFHEGFT